MGMYGVAAFAARTRRREFAVRAALGATRRELTTSMLRRELRTVLLGLGLGLGSAFSLASLLFGSAFETNPHDPLIYAAVGVLLSSVAVLATYVPIRSAASANPVDALQG